MAARKPGGEPLTRSQVMSRIRSRDTGPERALRTWLWWHGVRFRLRRRILGTRPDIAWTGRRVAVFVDGCFWHGCPIHYREPSTNTGFWRDKIGRNRERDRRDDGVLSRAGWTVLRFWEHEVVSDPDRVGGSVLAALHPADGRSG